MARQKLLLPFGGGIDRKTGSAVVEGDAFADLRNVHLYKGRMELRKGLERVLDIGWGTDIVAIESIRAQGLSAVVVYDAATYEVRLYVVDSDLITASLVGTLWTLSSALSVEPPSVVVADLYGKVIFCHDEEIFSARGATRVLDLATFALTDYTSDLNRDATDETVRARFCTRIFNSLLLVGYGTGSDEDRAETVRISKPGAPLTLVPETYFIVGDVGDPIIGVGKSGNVFELMKASETHFLVGNGPRTYDVVPGDDSFGLKGSRLFTTVGKTLYRWSLHGPRVSEGSASADLELPLDIAGPFPDMSQGEDEGFAFYDADEGEVVFVFGQWAYVLHLKDGAKRWSYRKFGVSLQSAGKVYEGGTASLSLAEATLGALSLAPVVYAGSPVPSIIAPWTLSGSLVGGEQVEVWVRSNYTGVWALMATVPATDLTITQAVTHWLTDHKVAIRVTLSGSPGAGYTSANPDLWPASSRATINSAGSITAIAADVWRRLSNTRPGWRLTYTGAGMGTLHPELGVSVEHSSDGGGSWHATTASMGGAGSIQVEHGNANVNVTTYRYRLTLVGPDASSALVTTADRLFEPYLPTGITCAPDAGGGAGHLHAIGATNLDGEAMECRARHLAAGSYAGPNDVPDGGTFTFDVPTDDVGSVEVSIRTKIVNGVTDYSSLVTTNTGVA